MKRILNTLAHKWPEYFIEAFVIVASIMGAFALDKWKDSQKESLQREEFVKSIITDLSLKKEEINSDLEQGLRLDTIMNNTVESWNKERYLSPEVVPIIITILSTERIYFGESTQTYDGAPSSASWKQLPDSIKRIVTNLHIERFDWVKEKFQLVSAQSQHILLNYLLPNNLHNKQLKAVELHRIIMKNPDEFFLYVTLAKNNLSDILTALRLSSETIDEVKTDLEQYLKLSKR